MRLKNASTGFLPCVGAWQEISLSGMEWYYAQGDRQCGPVSENELQQLANSGALPRESLVWREGMDNWAPFSSVQLAPVSPALVMAPAIASGNGTLCSECGRSFSTSEMVRVQNSWICAGCKPIFLQRLREGAPLAASGSLWRSANLLVTTTTGSVFPDRCLKC